MPLPTRRHFTKLALGTLSGTVLFPRLSPAAKKPDSKVAGVQIGLNVPYSFGEPSMSGDEILQKCLQLGLSGVELRTQPVETFLGLPAELSTAKKPKDAPKSDVPKKAEKLR